MIEAVGQTRSASYTQNLIVLVERMRYAKREHTDGEQQWRRPITRNTGNQARILRVADNRAQLHEAVATKHAVSQLHIFQGC